MTERTIRTHSDREWRALTKAMQRGADRMTSAPAGALLRLLEDPTGDHQ